MQFAEKLADYVEKEQIPNLRVWTSLMKRTIQTAQGINAPKEHWKALNEIDAVSFTDIHIANLKCCVAHWYLLDCKPLFTMGSIPLKKISEACFILRFSCNSSESCALIMYRTVYFKFMKVCENLN